MTDESNDSGAKEEHGAEETRESGKEKARHARSKKNVKKGSDKKPASTSVEVELEERVVAVNRCAKVVKGGRRFSFSALLVVGDKKGRVGYGLGKAKEVPEAIRKAKMEAQQNLIKVPLDGGTIPHETLGEFDAGKILFKPAAEGTGVKAAGACRAILELAGIRNILTKSLRGNNPHNIVKATFSALRTLRSLDEISSSRGKDSKTLRIKG